MIIRSLLQDIHISVLTSMNVMASGMDPNIATTSPLTILTLSHASAGVFHLKTRNHSLHNACAVPVPIADAAHTAGPRVHACLRSAVTKSRNQSRWVRLLLISLIRHFVIKNVQLTVIR